MKTNAQRNHKEENINIISRFLKALAPLSNNADYAIFFCNTDLGRSQAVPRMVKGLCGSDEHALEARITVNLDTTLYVAAGRGMGNHIVEYLLNKTSRDQVALQNSDSNTALSVAAIIGNIRAADLLMKKNVNLNRVANNRGWINLA
ncbi:hypothetical protein Pint_12066 [Pistacia integerrima]|uniref:Uncharacterized protein n=1 Tax=Pistacia integerrima TaxID=434235 RepID=A0ACC0XHC6_9ROSI|nr:hypothetical protein Pint_12066 [Pistacia integerrima]